MLLLITSAWVSATPPSAPLSTSIATKLSLPATLRSPARLVPSCRSAVHIEQVPTSALAYAQSTTGALRSSAAGLTSPHRFRQPTFQHAARRSIARPSSRPRSIPGALLRQLQVRFVTDLTLEQFPMLRCSASSPSSAYSHIQALAQDVVNQISRRSQTDTSSSITREVSERSARPSWRSPQWEPTGRNFSRSAVQSIRSNCASSPAQRSHRGVARQIRPGFPQPTRSSKLEVPGKRWLSLPSGLRSTTLASSWPSQQGSLVDAKHRMLRI